MVSLQIYHWRKNKFVDTDIDTINRRTKENSDYVARCKLSREKVFTDFRSSGYTEKLSNFYADTFFELAKENNTQSNLTNSKF